MTKQRRSIRGSGSVYQRKGDGRYVASFIVEETGKRKYLYADIDDNTEQNAYKKLQEALFQQKQVSWQQAHDRLLSSFWRSGLRMYINSR